VHDIRGIAAEDRPPHRGQLLKRFWDCPNYGLGDGCGGSIRQQGRRVARNVFGYGRSASFASPGGIAGDVAHIYVAGMPGLNEWSLSGDWTVGVEHAELNAKDGAIVYRFHARDVHLVLGPASGGEPVRFRETIDGAAPGDNHGSDVDAAGTGTVTEQRLYQLLRQSGPITDHTFEVHFLDPGVQAYAFTPG
jgi:hypothetical protein